MGFGYLLFGFLMLLELNIPLDYTHMIALDVFPDLAGYLLLLTAASRLEDYAVGFSRFKKALFPLVALSALEYALSLACLGGAYLSTLARLLSAIELVTLPLQALAFFCLFTGMAELSASLDLFTLVKRTRITLVVGMVYYLLAIVVTLCSTFSLPLSSVVLTPMQGFSTLLMFVFILLCEVVSFNGYMYICYEGEESVDPSGVKNPIERLVERIKQSKKD